MTFRSDAVAYGRAADLDLLKTLLVYGMIAAHVIQLITFGPKPELRAFSEFINLITFSGFMFAFGIGIALPRIEVSRPTSVSRRLQPVLLLLGGTYLSSLAFVVLVDREALTEALLLDLLTMTRLFGWSEFLATFLVLYLLVAVARPQLVRIGQTPWLSGAAAALCLATTMITVDAAVPLAAAIIGTNRFPSFPLLPYLPWFIVGVWYGSRALRAWHFGFAVAATAAYYLFPVITGDAPERFPPSAIWVIGSAAFLLLYLLVARTAARWMHLPRLLLLPGRHVLVFLVLSNLAIFGIRYVYGRPLRDTMSAVASTLAIVAAISLFLTVAQSLQTWLAAIRRPPQGLSPSDVREPVRPTPGPPLDTQS